MLKTPIYESLTKKMREKWIQTILVLQRKEEEDKNKKQAFSFHSNTKDESVRFCKLVTASALFSEGEHEDTQSDCLCMISEYI